MRTCSPACRWATSAANNLIQPGYRAWESGEYVQDDWRINSKLTVNLGLRYDIYTPFSEAHNRYANFNYPTLSIISGTTDPHVGVKTNHKNIAPRLGFSQSLSKGTVLRGGYGISYYPSAANGEIQLLGPAYEYANTCLLPTCSFSWPTMPVPQASSTSDLSGSLTYVPSNFNTAYVQQFNLVLQKEVGANVLYLRRHW